MRPASRIFAGLLLAAPTVAAMYAIAAATAGYAAGGFAMSEASGHARSVEFAAELTRVSVEHREARAKCERATAAERKACHAELRSDVKRVLRSLR